MFYNVSYGDVSTQTINDNNIKVICCFRTYDMFLEGEFVMYKHKTLPYQVIHISLFTPLF